MWKVSFTLLIFLGSVIGSMLFWQWHAYSQQNDQLQEEVVATASQQISIEPAGSILHLTQVIQGLTEEKEYRLSIPETMIEWSCLKSDGSNCESLDDNPTSFLAEDGSLTITANIGVKNGQAPFLVNDWLAQLPDLVMTTSRIEIIDSSANVGTWVTGFPLKGYKKLEYIDYYVFEGKGASTALFWHPLPLTVEKATDSLIVYAGEEINKGSFLLDSLEKLTDMENLTIVLTDHYPESAGGGLLITSSTIQQETLERKIVEQYILSKFVNLPTEETWIVDVLTSLISDQESRTEKGKMFIGELNNHLSEEELAQLIQEATNERTLSFKELDQLLSNVTSKQTRFFSLNKNGETALVPLFYTDPRKIIINDTIQKGIEIIYYEDKKLLPVRETLSAFGYTVELFPQIETLLVTKGNDEYRFFVGENIFMYNGKDYGLLENPLVFINGKTMMNYELIKTLFMISTEELTEQITLYQL